MEITKNIAEIRRNIAPYHADIVVVSKQRPIEQIEIAYQSGCRLFAENRHQELLTKSQVLPSDIQWHFIGSLQTNKVKYIVPIVTLIHSVDSARLLEEINKQATRIDKTMDVLLELFVAHETTKHGWDLDALHTYLHSGAFKTLSHVRIRGLMAMATYTTNQQQIHNEFTLVKKTFDSFKTLFFAADPSFDTISMGMSNDYPIALQEGSTMVRIGSNIFSDH